jgi:putative endonuclease
MTAYVYMLRCADGSFYVGSTRGTLEQRIAEHNAGTFGGYTAKRRPVQLAFSESFERIDDAIAAERQLKGWSRAKKQALIAGDFGLIRALSRRRRSLTSSTSSFETMASPSPQDEARDGVSKGLEDPKASPFETRPKGCSSG